MHAEQPDLLTAARPRAAAELTALERRLLNEYQRGLPLVPSPFAVIAERLGVSEAAVLDALRRLRERGVVTRVGAVFRPNRAGASTLAAMRVPEDRIVDVAQLVSAYPEVNHNYQREHAYNLWFVVTAQSREAVCDVLNDIASRTGLAVLDLPMERDYHIDLGFPLWC